MDQLLRQHSLEALLYSNLDSLDLYLEILCLEKFDILLFLGRFLFGLFLLEIAYLKQHLKSYMGFSQSSFI